MFALGFLAGAVICGTACFFVGLTIGDAPTLEPTYLDDREGVAAGPPPTSGRGSLRAVGGSTAGTRPHRRGSREAGAHGRAGAAHDAPVRRPPDGPPSTAA